MKHKIKFSLNPTFFAFAAFFLSGDLYFNYLNALMFAFLHETGHLAAMLLFGVFPDRIALEIQGIRIDKNNLTLSYCQECVLALAGPVVNLLFMIFFDKSSLVFIVNSGLFFINLLPLKSLDGGRFLYSFIAMKKDEITAERVILLSELLTLCLLIISLALLLIFRYANMSISVFTVLLIVAILSDLFSTYG